MRIDQTRDLINQILAHAATRLPDAFEMRGGEMDFRDNYENDLAQWVGLTSEIIFEAIKRRNMPVEKVYERAVRAVETKFRTEAVDRVMSLEIPKVQEVEENGTPVEALRPAVAKDGP